MACPFPDTAEQQRRRVSSRIRNEIRQQTADDLLEMSRVGKAADQWTTPGELNRQLEEQGYWTSHPHILASFLSLDTCEQVLEGALEDLVSDHPEAWVRSGERYKPAMRDLNAYAAQKANELGREAPTAEPTVIHGGPGGESILFAHDNYANSEQANQQLTLLRGYLFEAGIPELGFGISDDGRTWVMIVWSQDESALRGALLRSWQSACSSDLAAAAA
jgi:hypothetical protein